MELMLNKKTISLIPLGLLSLLLVWQMRPLAEELSASHIVLSMEPLENGEPTVQRALEENLASSSASGGNPQEPDLRDEIERAKSRLSKSEYRSAKSNYQRMLEHMEKLEKYKKDPLKFDNQGLLRNAPNEQVRQKIIESRIAHLEREIQTFYNNITKIIAP